jgi:mono/diheme cytochrome c family protein
MLMKRIFKWIAVLVAIILLGFGGLLAYIKYALPDLDPPEDLVIEYTEDRIEHGRYLAHSVMICMDCHSRRDYAKFGAPMVHGTLGAGGELFGKEMGFPGNFYSPNITPYGIKDWTDGEVFRAITTGVTKNGKALFPIMPYHNYGTLDREDIYAVIAYLRSLEPIPTEVPPSSADFPMKFIINTIPKRASFTLKPSLEDKIAYGKYVFTSAGCNDCHTPAKNGTPIPGLYLAGGFEFPLSPTTLLRSANITPDEETGIGNWTEEKFINEFKKYSEEGYEPTPVAENEYQTVMPWLFYTSMEEDDLKAIWTYLQTVPPIKNKVMIFEKRDASKKK